MPKRGAGDVEEWEDWNEPRIKKTQDLLLEKNHIREELYISAINILIQVIFPAAWLQTLKKSNLDYILFNNFEKAARQRRLEDDFVF